MARLTAGTRLTAGARQRVRDFGTCLIFSGASDCVEFTDADSLDPVNTLSVTAWVKPTSLGPSNGGRVADKEGGTGQSWGFLMGPTNGIRFFINNTLYNSSLNVIRLGVWQHVAGTFDKDAGSNQIKFYVNGVAAGTATRSTAFTANSAALRIGNNSANSRNFDGKLDEIKVYNRVLSPTEITDEFNGNNSSTSGLVLYTKFDEGSGSAAIDSSGTQANGTITGATYSTDVFMKPRTAA